MANRRQQPPDYYEVLGVRFDATDDELRSAWRVAAKRWHPDTNRSPEAHRMMARLNEAWEILGDPDQRAKYDKQRDPGSTRENRHRSQGSDNEGARHQRRSSSSEGSRGSGQSDGRRRQREDRKTRRERERRGRKSMEDEERRRHAEEDLRRREEELRRREEEMFKREDEARRARERKRRIQEQTEQAARQQENLKRRQPSGPGFIRRHFYCVGWVVILLITGGGWLLSTYGEDWYEQLRSLGDSISFVSRTPSPVTTLVDQSPSPAPTATPGPTGAYSALPTPDATPAIETNEIATRALWTALRGRTTRDEVANLISLGADVSDRNHRQTMFELAVDRGIQSSIVQLLSVGVRPQEATRALWSRLDRGGNPQHELVLYLIGLGADVTAIGQYGSTMFERAMSGDYEDSIVQLFAAPLSVDAATRGLWSALERGTTRAEVEHYIGFGADVTEPDSDGRTMIEYATERGYATPVQQSLSEGSSVETTTEVLWSALERGTTPGEVAKLIGRGADVTVPNRGKTMFEFIVNRGESDSLAQLLSADLSVEAATGALWSKLYRTENRPTFDEIIDLIGLGADVSVLNSRGETMFEYAVGNYYETSVVQLLSAFLSNEGATAALWSALVRGTTPEEVEYYVGQGADVSEPNSNLETMSHFAVARGYSAEVLEVLESAGRASQPTPNATLIPIAPDLTAQGSGSETLFSRRLRDTVSIGGLQSCLRWGRSAQRLAIATEVSSGGVEFSFVVPPASDWSIGFVYHIDNPYGSNFYSHTATFIAASSETGVQATHRTVGLNGLRYEVEPIPITDFLFNVSEGALNNVSIHTDRTGTELELNGTSVLSVPGYQLRPRRGPLMICAGILMDEPEDYSIEVVGLRAWTDEAWR